ncbi:hypothetical protein GCM10029964_079700 [Kibdelosporangium lantanae]
MSYEVVTDDLRAHVSHLEGLMDRVQTAMQAAQSVSMDDQAYGLICAFLPAIISPMQEKGAQAMTDASNALGTTADNVNKAIAAYEDQEQATAQPFESTLDTEGDAYPVGSGGDPMAPDAYYQGPPAGMPVGGPVMGPGPGMSGGPMMGPGPVVTGGPMNGPIGMPVGGPGPGMSPMGPEPYAENPPAAQYGSMAGPIDPGIPQPRYSHPSPSRGAPHQRRTHRSPSNGSSPRRRSHQNRSSARSPPRRSRPNPSST